MDQKNSGQKVSLIEEIKRRLTLEELLEKYGVKKGTSKNSYFCPFHEDKNPSFVASNEKGWKCFSNSDCGSGDQISFIQKYERVSFEEALIKASNIVNITKEEKKGKRLINELQERHLTYLENRGIKPETAKLFNLKAKNDYILFPQKRDDKITGYKAIDFVTKKMFFDGVDRASKLFPDYELEGIKTVIFTAGEYDCIYLTQKLLESNLNDYKVLISSTGEGSFPKDLDRLNKFPDIESFKIFYDHDEAGKKGALKLSKELLKLNKIVEVFYFPDGKKEKYDVSDFFNEGNSLEDLFNLEKIIYTPEKKDNLLEPLYKLKLGEKKDVLGLIDTFDFVEPMEYQVDDDGVKKIIVSLRDEKIDKVSSLPVLITKQAINTDDDIINLELSFKKNDEWKKLVVERATICDTKKILEICNTGFPVHSGNAKKMVEYLHDFEIANLSRMQTIYLTHNNGWKKIKKQTLFGLGKNILGVDEEKNDISFSPELGFEKFTKALNTSGSYDEWLKNIKPLMKNPKIAFAIYASLAAPFLNLVDCSSFLIHFWGETSLGKTTIMEIASSVWGKPDKETGGLITSWNNTMVFVERLASFFNDLPMFLDDSQTTDDKTVSKIMYMIGNSTGRGRGKKAGGVDANKSWHTVCFSTGEKQLTESTQYDGAKARTIEFKGSPFGRNEGKVVNEVKTCVRENYGHLGNLFMQDILIGLNKNEEVRKEFLDDIKELYNHLRTHLSEKTENEIGNRMSSYFAVIELTGELVESTFNLGGNPHEVVETCFLEAINERKKEGDTSTRALNEIVSFCQANIKCFLNKCDDFNKENFGVWKDGEYIAIHTYKLKEILTKMGFNYTSIISSWGDREWTKKDYNRNTFQISFTGQRFRTIAIKWQTINSLE